jgi:hypothetical protein|tara:strand:- start:2733 stop:2885 length:153 start_codon:yes stop_codon:yes gene_type:complete
MCISAAIFEYEDEEHFQREELKKHETTDNICHYSGLLSTESYSSDEPKKK